MSKQEVASKHNGELVRSAREHVFAMFRAGEHQLEYHQFTTTSEVAAAAKVIAKGSKLDDDVRELAVLCAWFYDACYAVGSDDHDRSRELCVHFLEQQGAVRPTREAIAACFRGVVENAVPGDPNELTSSRASPWDVLHDARLAVLASEEYIERAETLRFELQHRTGKTYSDVEWTQHCIAFFGAHPYRTRFAQLMYGSERAANLARLQKRLRRQERALERRRAPGSGAEKRVGKSAENLFYHFARIQIGVMGVADRRTSTMIHVNAIMLSIVVALLAHRIHSDRDLLLPTVLMLAVNMAVVFLAIYSMRAGRRRGHLHTLTEEEARARDANVLALTNEIPISLSEYTAQMNALLEDPAEFQRKVIEHLYLGRKELVARAKALRTTYTVFLSGVTVALLAFVVTFALR